MAEQRGDPADGRGSGSSWLRIGAIAVVFVLAVVAARARAAGHLPHLAGPPGPLVLGAIRAVGIGVLSAGLLLLVWGRRVPLRKVLGGGPGKKKLTTDEKQRIKVAVLFGLVAGIAFQILQRLFGSPNQQKKAGGDDAQDMPIREGHGWISQHGQQGLPHAGVGTYLSAAVALVALIALVAILLRRREVIVVEEDDEEEETETLAQAMVAGQAAVRDRTILDARQAIVACFAAMERVLAGFGGEVAPRAADTPEEVLHRGIRGASLPEPPAQALLELFREARFSMHPMRPADRDRADAALAEMLGALGVAPERSR
jgi:hypothetical protein